MSLELKRIIGDDREVIPVPQHGIQQEVKQEMKGSETPRFSSTPLPKPLKRGSVGELDSEDMDRSPSSPTKRRKSVPSSIQWPMKAEASVLDIENAEAGSSIY